MTDHSRHLSGGVWEQCPGQPLLVSKCSRGTGKYKYSQETDMWHLMTVKKILGILKIFYLKIKCKQLAQIKAINLIVERCLYVFKVSFSKHGLKSTGLGNNNVTATDAVIKQIFTVTSSLALLTFPYCAL